VIPAAGRTQGTAYDACYLQLALELSAPLVTRDAQLARAYDQAIA
jgi:predicted nucleic acid-binding protein